MYAFEQSIIELFKLSNTLFDFDENEHYLSSSDLNIKFIPNITDKVIEKMIKEKQLTSVEELTNASKAGGACGNCIPEIENIDAHIIESMFKRYIENA